MRATPFLLFILYLVYCVKIFDFRLNECKYKLNANLNEHKIEVIFFTREKNFSIFTIVYITDVQFFSLTC